MYAILRIVLKDGAVKHARVAKQIGPVTTRSKHPPLTIEEQAKRIVEDANVTNKAPERVLTVTDFVDRVYFRTSKSSSGPALRRATGTFGTSISSPKAEPMAQRPSNLRRQSWFDSMAKPEPWTQHTAPHQDIHQRRF